MEPCVLGGDKLKRIMRWTSWHREAKSKMRLMGINDNVQRLNCLRRWAGEELTEIWEKEEFMEVKANREGEGAVSAHTYGRVVEGTMMTLLSNAWSMQVTLQKQEGDSEGDGEENTTTANDEGGGEEGAEGDQDDERDGDDKATTAATMRATVRRELTGTKTGIGQQDPARISTRIHTRTREQGARKSRACTRPTTFRPRPRTS